MNHKVTKAQRAPKLQGSELFGLLAEIEPGGKQVGAFQPDPYPGEDLLLLRALGG